MSVHKAQTNKSPSAAVMINDDSDDGTAPSLHRFRRHPPAVPQTATPPPSRPRGARTDPRQSGKPQTEIAAALSDRPTTGQSY